MKWSVTALLLLATAGGLWAQDKPQGLTSQPNQTDSALTAEIRRVFVNETDNILKAAQSMPEAAYSFKPTPEVRSFGELIGHIANVQSTLCASINGRTPKSATQPTSKANAIKDMQNSVSECTVAFSELSAENANKMVDAPVGHVTHLAALVYIITHASEEYGQISIYLRLNHILPPSSDEPKSGGAAGKAKT